MYNSTLDFPSVPDPSTPTNTPQPLTAEPGTVSGAKLTGGAVELAGKVVTGVFHTSTGDVSFFYVQEPVVGGNGIKVVPEIAVPVEPGNIVTVKGNLINDPSEVYIYGNVTCTGSMKRPGPAGMVNRACAGGEFGEQPALYATSSLEGTGLSGVGTRIRVWGSILDTGTENGHAVMYIDDGSALSTGTYDGLKVVYWDADDAPTGLTYISGQTGILGAEIVDGKPVPVIRVPEMVPYEAPSGGVKYVKPGGTGDGSSWINAFGSIQDAIDAAYLTTPKCEVWVAGSETPYYENLYINSGVSVYGGFAGNETLREQRNWTANETIVDGFINGTVVSMDSSTENTRIDGFTIQNGISYSGGGGISCSSGALITNNTITGNYDGGSGGGGIYCTGSSSIWSNTISENTQYWNGGGIYCSGNAIIANNDITGNTVEEGSGGGISCEGNTKVINNHITSNTAYFGGGISCSGVNPVISRNLISDNTANSGSGICCNSGTGIVKMTSNVIIENSADGIYCNNRSADIINNTIAWNGTGSTGDGICLTGTSTKYTIMNNIVYSNLGFGIRGVTGIDIFLENNDSYDQTSNYDTLGTISSSNISADPLFMTTSSYNIHLQETSPCKDAGLDFAVSFGDKDIDGDIRIMNNRVDIGADEVNGCAASKLLVLLPRHTTTAIGASACLRANVFDYLTGEPISGAQVDVMVDTGEIVKVTRNGNIEILPENTQSTYGVTDSLGNVDIYVTRTSAGDITLNTSIGQCDGQMEDQVTVSFIEQSTGLYHVGFMYDLCTRTCTTYEDVDQYMTSIDQYYSDVVYERLGDIRFGIDGLFNTVIVALPERSLTKQEIASLSQFVESGRAKRVVLVGEFNPTWSNFNTKLNIVAAGIGMHSEFRTDGYIYDNELSLIRQCDVEQTHYLMEGVISMWDAATDYFINNGDHAWNLWARPLAYLHDSKVSDQPFIIEEDTETKGSRVAIHDSSVFYIDHAASPDLSYDDTNDTIPNRNFKFVYNLCTKFQQ